ncbi:molybdopterin-guanine dinucleotide biosynthesis protein B [soil metagenome]
MTHRVIGVAGFKNSGKTTLVEKLVTELTRRGYRISTVKHAHHSFDIDHEGRDSFRHRKAGASEVAVVSHGRWALLHELRGEPEPPLETILAKLAPCDLVIVEGYKRDMHDKIEMRDVTQANPALASSDPSIVAIAANGDIAGERVPVFSRDEIGRIADFIVQHMGLAK